MSDSFSVKSWAEYDELHTIATRAHTTLLVLERALKANGIEEGFVGLDTPKPKKDMQEAIARMKKSMRELEAYGCHE